MKLLTWIILISLSLTLGGTQILLTAGKQIAQARAIKFQKIRSGNSRAELHWMTFSNDAYENLSIIEVGHGVIEFELNGWKYDAFEMKDSNGQVHLLVKKDNLDTQLNHIYKASKRYLEAKGQSAQNQLFNFYFPAKINAQLLDFRAAFVQISNLISHYQPLRISVPSPPPWL